MLGLALPLGGCSWVGQVAQDSVEGAFSYYSFKRFTLEAQVPANFGFIYKAHYYPTDGQGCQISGREHQTSDRIEAKPIEQSSKFRIPLGYHIAGCAMKLTSVSYELNGTYGKDAWDHGLDHAGGLSIRDSLSDNYPHIPESGIQSQHGVCRWLFQISTAKAKKGEIEKILSCNATDDQWQVPLEHSARRKPGGAVRTSEVDGKTVQIEFRLSLEELPAQNDSWVKFPEGWKRCLGDGEGDVYGFCRGNTKDFRTFKQGVNVCTIYPGCTERGSL